MGDRWHQPDPPSRGVRFLAIAALVVGIAVIAVAINSFNLGMFVD